MKAAAGASLPAAREAAELVLAQNGSAADAVVAGFFAIAGVDPSGLFAPCVALVAGAAALGRVFDGRATQPGAGIARPRGFVGQPPPAARAAVPRAPQAMLLLHATFGRRSLREVVRAGGGAAKACGASKRASFIDRFGELGALALSREHAPILRVAGPLASGLITETDLGAVRVQDQAALLLEAEAETGEAMRVALEPWPVSVTPRGGSPSVVVAVDQRGLIAALTVFLADPAAAALTVPELEVTLPLCATPVLRGQPRTPPGALCDVPRTLWSLDCGAQLRIAGAATGDGLGERDAAAVASALALRPIDRGLSRLAQGGPVVAALVTASDARVANVEPGG